MAGQDAACGTYQLKGEGKHKLSKKGEDSKLFLTKKDKDSRMSLYYTIES